MKKNTCYILLLSFLLAGCSKDDHPSKQDNNGSGIVLVDGTNDGPLAKSVSQVTDPSARFNLFEPLSEADSLAVVSAQEIIVVLDGQYLDDAVLSGKMKDLWDRLYSFHAHKLILVYDGSRADSELTARVAGFYTGNDYYIRTFGRTTVCQVIDQEALDHTTLEQTMDEVRERRARGMISVGADQNEMNQFSFSRPVRFNIYRAHDEYGANENDSFVTGKAVESVMRDRSMFGDFIVHYTIYSAKGYKDRYLLVEVTGAGFTNNILRTIKTENVSLGSHTHQTDVLHTKNFMRFYDVGIEVIGKTKIPIITQALPTSENGSKTVSENRSASLGFKITDGKPSFNGSVDLSLSVSYDQPSFTTKPSYSTDATKHSFKQMWETRPVYGYKGAKAFYENNSLDLKNLYHFGYVSVKGYSQLLFSAYKYDLSNPAWFPIPFYSFSPQVSLLAYLEEDEVTVRAGVEVHYQDDLYDYYHNRHEISRPYREIYDQVKITFTGENILWQ